MIDLDDVELWPQPPRLLESLGLRVHLIEPGTPVAVLVRHSVAVSPAESFALLTQARGYAEAAGFEVRLVPLPNRARRRRWWQRLTHPNPSTPRRSP